MTLKLDTKSPLSKLGIVPSSVNIYDLCFIFNVGTLLTDPNSKWRQDLIRSSFYGYRPSLFVKSSRGLEDVSGPRNPLGRSLLVTEWRVGVPTETTTLRDRRERIGWKGILPCCRW